MAKISKRRPAKGSAANLDTANHADDAAPHNAGMESAPRKKSDAADDDVHATAIKRWTAGHERERENIDLAYEDLEFLEGDQWPADAVTARASEKRPVQTFNRMPQFVRQI